MRRYLVVHDYGMGGLWWWIWASSPEEIVETLAGVEVVDESSAAGAGEDIEEVRLDALVDQSLIDMRDRRAAQRLLPGYGVLAGRDRVYLRDADESYGGTVFLSEIGPDGRQLRMVEQPPRGDALRIDDFPINAPLDLRDPALAAREISGAAFEQAWRSARPEGEQAAP
jgi:hypothetical protein